MNRIYRIVWNTTIGRWVVASEMAKGQKKKTSRGDRTPAGAAVMFAATMMVGGGTALPAYAQSLNPSGVLECYLFPKLYTKFCSGGGGTAPPAPTPESEAALKTLKYFKANSGHRDANPSGYNATAMGPGATSTGNATLAAGFDANAGGGAYASAYGAHTNASASYATAVGPYSKASANDSTALGSGANAGHRNSVALGAASQTYRENTVSIGNGTLKRQITEVAKGTAGTDAVNVDQLRGVTSALGGGAAIAADGSVSAPSYVVGGNKYSNVGDALTAAAAGAENKYFKASSTGPAAVASGGEAVAIGSQATSSGDEGLAVGHQAKAAGRFSSAIGSRAQTKGTFANAIGTYAAADAEKAQAVGHGAQASGLRATAVGPDSKAAATDAVAVGSTATAQHDSAVALGTGAVTDRADSVAVGNGDKQRQITRVAAGTQGTDAVNVNQLKGVTNALGGGAAVDGQGNVTAPSYVVDGSSYSNVGDALAAAAAAGGENKYFKANSTGAAPVASGVEAVAMGSQATASGEESVASGFQAKAAGRFSSASGARSRANGNFANALGTYAGADAEKAQALGHNALANGRRATAVGPDSKASAADAVAIGSAAAVQHANAVALGAGAVSDRTDSVSVGNADKQRQITQVAAGTEDKDAVNVEQLKAAGIIDGEGAIQRAVLFDGPNGEADLKGRRVVNVADAVANTDAVTLGQLKGSGIGFDASGRALTQLVAYAPVTAAARQQSMVVLNENTLLRNVAAGQVDTDAANVGQVRELLRQTGQATGVGATGVGADAQARVQSRSAIPADAGTFAASRLADPQLDVATLPSDGSGIPATGGRRYADYENNYLMVLGRLDGVGSTQPTDAALVLASGGMALGTNARGFAANGSALGNQAVVAEGATDSVALGAGSVANESNVVSVGTDGTTSFDTYDANSKKITIQNKANSRRIVNMAAGRNDNDAVNVEQLKGVTTALGGGAAVGADGTVSAPTYEIGGAKYSNVGDALKAAAVAGGDGALAVKYSDATKTAVALEGKGGTTLGNVKAGTAAMDAVNVGQLQGAGIIDGDGKVQKAVLFNGPNGEANAASQKLVNLSKGTAGTDAVNVDQLKGVTTALGGGAAVGTDGTVTAPSYTIDGTKYGNVGDALQAAANAGGAGSALAVKYTDADKGEVALEGKSGSSISNLKAAVADDEAVNLKQLKDAGLTVDPGTGNVTNAFVAYDGTDKAKVTFGGANGTTLSNVKAGVADMDAVNVKQFKDAGIIDGDGKVQKAVLFNGPNGEANAASQKLVNLSKGTAGTDAVNVDQLKGVTTALGGGAAVGTDGTVTAPSYTIDGTKYGNVGDALQAAANAGSAGTALAVKYDGNTKDVVTLEGKTGTTLTNVKAGTAATDAVNVGQLQGAGIIDDKGNVQKAVLFNGPNGDANAAGTKLVGLKAGTDGTDGVNVKQLTDAGITVDPTTGEVTNAFVAYDSTSRTKVTLGGTGGTTIANVKSATADDQAVNLAQLKGAGITVDNSGKVTNAFVAYDTADKKAVTLGGGTDGTALRNVKAGAANTDATNVSQLRGLAGALGGGASVSTTGAIVRPSYELGGNTFNTVGDALDDLDRRTIENSNAIDDLTAGNGIRYFRANSEAEDAIASGTDATAMGPLAQASGDSSTAAGNNARALDEAAAAFGFNAEASAVNSTALGANALASQSKAVAIGSDAKAEAAQAVVIGASAGATGKNGVALGAGASANAEAAIALGNNARAAHANAVAVGAGSVTARDNSVSVGNATQSRQITYVGAGTSETDAVNVKQLKDAGIVVDDKGNVTNAFVAYDAANKQKVTLAGVGGTTLSNVKAGTAATDAVNVGQLQGAGIIDGDGKVQKAVLFNGPNGEANAAGQKLVGLAAGTANTDGVNLKQLKDAGIAVDDKGNVTNAFVAYDAADKQKVTFAGAGGTTLANVKAGSADMDAVNVKQLKDAGIVDGDGKSLKAVLFNGPNGEANAASQKLVNLSKGTAGTDAVNVDQLKGVTTALGGGAAVGTDGAVTAPSYEIGGTKYSNVGDALQAAAQAGGDSALAVKYDSATKDVVTLEGKTGTTITNLKAGVADTDAVNVSQLKASGLVDGDGKAQKAVLFNGPNGEANAAGQKLVNLAAGTSATDAVNFGQLDSAGLVDAKTGQILRGITYVAGSIEAGAPMILLEPGKGNSRFFVDNDRAKGFLPKGTVISNVAEGVQETDATNLGQVRDLLKGSQIPTPLSSVPAVQSRRGQAEVQLEVAALPSDGSGIVSDGSLQKNLIVENDYLRALGRTDGVGNTPATDAALANGFGAVSIGANSRALSNNSTALGLQSVVTQAATDSVALGSGSVATEANVVSVGTDGTTAIVTYDRDSKPITITNQANTRRIVNMAAGYNDNDAVNVTQLRQVTTALGGGASVAADGSVTQPSYSVAGGSYSNVGDALKAVDAKAATGSALGVVYDGADKSKVTFGGTGGTTLSNVKAGVADTDAVNVSQLKASGLVDTDGNAVSAVTYDDAARTSITLGGKGATTPVRISNVADAQVDNDAVNLKQLKNAGLVGGDGSTLNAVVYDEGSSRGSVTFGGASGTVLNNVADGQIAAGSRQAVNGGQIATLRDALQGQINGLDGRVTKVENDLKTAGGSVPYVSVQGPGADANAGGTGSGSVAVGGDAKALGDHSVAVGNGAQVQAEAPNAVALGNGSVADRAGTVSVGAPGSERAIANVANGTADTDAVNVRQMNQGIQSAKDYTDSRVDDAWNALNRDVDQMNRQVNRGIAAASALVNVTPYLPGRTAINAGVASYRGEAALGVGLSRWSDNGRFNFNAGVSAAKDDEPVYRIGVGYVF